MPDFVLSQLLDDTTIEAVVGVSPILVVDHVLDDTVIDSTLETTQFAFSLDQTLEDVTLFSTSFQNDVQLVLSQTLDNITLTAKAFLTNRAEITNSTAEARLIATLQTGEPPPEYQQPSAWKIRNLTGQVRASGGALLCFIGPANRSVEWRMIQGHGTLTPFTSFTDELGRCTCRFDAVGFAERVVVGAAFVP